MLHPTSHDKWIQDLLHLELSDRAVRDREDETLEQNHQQQFQLDQQHHAAIVAGAESAHSAAVRKRQEEADALAREEEYAAAKAQHAAEELKRQKERAHLDALAKEKQAKVEHDRIIAEKQAKLREIEENAERERLARESAAAVKAEAVKPTPTPTAAIVTPAPIAAILNTPPPAQPSSRPPAAAPTVSNAGGSSTATPLLAWSQLQIEHDAYIKLHGSLKDMRKHMIAAYKRAQKSKNETGRANPPIENMADMRRQIQKNLGQLTQDSQKNKTIRAQILNIMRAAWNTKGVMLSAKHFIIRPSSPIPDDSSPDSQVSGVFVYLVNILIKAALKLTPTAASNLTYNAVDPIGVILAFVISIGEFRVAGNAFSDIYLAKYHKSCPPLFGIHGLETTKGGRVRLGWQQAGDGTFVDSNTHYDRLNGVASGYAALTLRDFSRTKEKNALPAWNYWRSIAGIVNLEGSQLTKSHAVILKGLINQYAHHFVKFYGTAAIGVLQIALIQKPQQAPADTGFDTLAVVRDNLKTQFALEI